MTICSPLYIVLFYSEDFLFTWCQTPWRSVDLNWQYSSAFPRCRHVAGSTSVTSSPPIVVWLSQRQSKGRASAIFHCNQLIRFHIAWQAFFAICGNVDLENSSQSAVEGRRLNRNAHSISSPNLFSTSVIRYCFWGRNRLFRQILKDNNLASSLSEIRSSILSFTYTARRRSCRSGANEVFFYWRATTVLPVKRSQDFNC